VVDWAMSEVEVREFINDVKIAFMMKNPFFYFLLNDMEIIYVDEISEQKDDNGNVIASTPLAVEGTKLFIFKNALGDSCVKAYPISTIKHELIHIALGHCCRGAAIIRYMAVKHNLVLTEDNIEKVRFLINLAMDAKDNYMLKLDGDNVSWGFTGDKMWGMDKVEKCSVEELVEMIFDKPPCKADGFGAGIDILTFADGVGKGKTIQEGDKSLKGLRGKELEDKIKQKVTEAVVKAKMAGVDRGDVLRQFEESILMPKQQAWWLKIRNLMRSQTFKSKITDWRVINRKLPNQIAGSKTIKKPKCACFIDVSGSITPKEYQLFMTEMLLASKECDVTGIFWDGGIQEIRKIQSKKDVGKQVRGGGGTTFKPVLDNFDFNGYDIMVCLTDGEWYDVDSATDTLKKLRNVYKILCTSKRVVEGFDENIKIVMEED
jgi:predicted metal-dependent peptidase